MATRASNITGLITLLLFTSLLAYLLLRKIPENKPVVKDERSVQGIDTPFGYHRRGESGFDPRLIELSIHEQALIPEAVRFMYPMGAENGAFTYNAQKFWENNPTRGGKHTGDDLNGIGGMNSDYGDPVYSIANGRVVYTGVPSPGWGKTVIVAHRLNSGDLVQSMYAHLKSISVRSGQTVECGKLIGEVGTADGQYLAHLHFELRKSSGVDLGAGYTSQQLNRIDPEGFLTNILEASPVTFHDAVLDDALQIDTDSWQGIKVLGK